MGFEGKISPESSRHARVLRTELPLDEFNKIQMKLSEIAYDKYHPDEKEESGGRKMLWWIQHGYAQAYGDLEFIDVDDLDATLDEVEAAITRH